MEEIPENAENFLITKAKQTENAWELQLIWGQNGVISEQNARIFPQNENPKGELEHQFGILIYEKLQRQTGITPPWGILTGVRPIKLFRQCVQQGMSEEQITAHFAQRQVSEKKIRLALETAKKQENILKTAIPESFSLYIAIPFCPSRCSYCSFVSHSVAQAGKLIQPYVQLLCEEIRATLQQAKHLGLRLTAIYMGGGTPTTLTAAQLRQIFGVIRENWDLRDVLEYTVEAGRPDTIDQDKLLAIKEAGVTRISINPQTLNDRVLALAGRKHSAQDVRDCYALARGLGFDNINMDLIAGLPGDTLESFRATLDELAAMEPENITVHSLAKKRASNMSEAAGGAREPKPAGRPEGVLGHGAAEMVDYAQQKLLLAGYSPYYLYRQRNTADNLENTGFARPGRESYYNVYIMEEVQTILACGAGAVTKLKAPNGSYLERIFNYKYPYEYISRFGDMLKRKERVAVFYEGDHTA